jgi:hypothetical protein
MQRRLTIGLLNVLPVLGVINVLLDLFWTAGFENELVYIQNKHYAHRRSDHSVCTCTHERVLIDLKISSACARV